MRKTVIVIEQEIAWNSTSELRKVLKTMKSTKAVGPDDPCGGMEVFRGDSSGVSD